MRTLLSLLLATLALFISAEEPDHETQSLEGWTVHVHTILLKDNPKETARALELMSGQLKEIVRVVPARAVAELRKVPLWVVPKYQGIGEMAEYHPDAGWLRGKKRNAKMAKGIEFTNVLSFEAECKRMPMLLLHELAHGYHDRFLSFEQPDIIAAYKKAVENKSYDKVQRHNGRIERAYAMSNHKEYFAETSEAFFGRNDFFPFTREELEKHDPEVFKVLERVWNPPEPAASK
jgi:hypothetical protein